MSYSVKRKMKVGLIFVSLLILLLALTGAANAEHPGGHPQGGNYHTIQRGDTLGKIAQRYGVTIAALMHANPQIHNPDIIYAGAKLLIPSGSAMQPAKNPANTMEKPVNNSEKSMSTPVGSSGTGGKCRAHHYIQWGQTLSEIALHYRVAAQAIMHENGIQNPNLIYAGTTLCIP